MRGAITICRVAHIPVDIQASYPPVFLFVSWALAARFFPTLYPEWSVPGYWVAGFLSSVLLFGSLLAHELGHAFAARWRGLSVFRISLFFLGGVAEIGVDDGTPGDEFWMTLAGPATSFLLAAGFVGVWLEIAARDQRLGAIALYLGMSNALLAAFNLLPGYPLDGGRLLRAVLWRILDDQARATRWASWLGLGIGIVGVASGLVCVVAGDALVGIWLAAIGVVLILAVRGRISLLLTSPS